MKKYIRLIALLPLVLLLPVTSCKDFLETKSNSIFTEESSFQNLDFATKAVYGIYANLTVTNDFYDYYVGYFFKCDTDIELSYSTEDGARNSLAHYSPGQEGNSTLIGSWNVLYQTIERANLCIGNLPKSPIWKGEFASDAQRLYAEAVTLRALCYYELISLWGDVPFVTASVKAGDNYNIPKTDRDEIYEFLIKDLKDIQGYLPWMKEIGTAERIGRGFAKGLRARMAMAYGGYSLRNVTLQTRRGRHWQEYYAIARQECLEIMESGQHRLNPSYEGIFRTIHAYQQDVANGEILFEVGYGRLFTGRVGQSIGMPFATSPAEPKYGRAAGEIRVSPYYHYSFDTTDVRRNVNVELYSYANTSFLGQQRLVGSTSFSPTKWRRSWIVPSMGGDLKEVQATGINWPLMRYSDVVLMFAEAENELNGPTQLAKDALASVRQRAFTSSNWPEKITAYVNRVGSSKTAFFEAIVDERAWEFGGEMVRKYDLVRWNLLYTKIQKMKEENLKILSNDPQYRWVPDNLFWKYKSDNETLDILNPNTRLAATSVAGYTRTAWLPTSSASTIATFKTNQDRVAAGLSAAKNNHLYPIPLTVITASNGLLKNDQIP
jgi:hypothetical protein